MHRIEILIVEDNPGHAKLTACALKRSSLKGHIHIVEDGEEAMAFLQKRGRYADAVTPNLVLLDLNLPRKDGREVLAEVKADPALRWIPIVVFSTSEEDSDITDCYMKYANCYVTKPARLEQYRSTIGQIEDFWIDVARMPRRDIVADD